MEAVSRPRATRSDAEKPARQTDKQTDRRTDRQATATRKQKHMRTDNSKRTPTGVFVGDPRLGRAGMGGGLPDEGVTGGEPEKGEAEAGCDSDVGLAALLEDGRCGTGGGRGWSSPACVAGEIFMEAGRVGTCVCVCVRGGHREREGKIAENACDRGALRTGRLGDRW